MPTMTIDQKRRAHYLSVAPEQHMVIVTLRDEYPDGVVTGYECIFIGDWNAAQRRCTERQDAARQRGGHMYDYMVRSSRDPKWQHLVLAGMRRKHNSKGEFIYRHEAAARLNSYVKDACQIDQHSAGGWFYRNGRPYCQGSEDLFHRIGPAVLVETAESYYAIVGIKGGST